MMKDLYDIIFKRKSMRRFDEALYVKEDELLDVKREMESMIPLVEDIKIRFEVVQREKTTVKRGEYCLLMYSEEKPHYLLNAGYMLEQMDLYLTSRNIGVCWYALAKPHKMQVDGLDYIIMLNFGKSRPQDFRKSIKQFRRKKREEIWNGDFDSEVIEAVRLTPSACNTQPWRFFSDGNLIKIYRNKKIKSFIPQSKLPYYNSIDMGICLYFLEIALINKGYEFSRRLILDKGLHSDLVEIATYNIR